MKRWPVVLAAMCAAMALSATLVPARAESGPQRVDRTLSWPEELPRDLPPAATRFQPAKSNYVIDLHGSAAKPDLVVFMAGNQYRALPDLTREFRKWIALQPQWKGLPAENIFYATLPPGKLIEAMESGLLVLGNYWIEVSPAGLWPDVFMTGPRQQQRLFKLGLIDRYSPYASNRGSVLLVRAGNPLRINGVNDLSRPDVRVAISSPAREPASYDSYSSTIDAQGGAGLSKTVLAKSNTLTPEYVHHRENPQFIAEQLADVAPMYYHFGEYLKARFPGVFDYVQLPPEGNTIDSLAIARIKSAPRPRAADAWMQFMRSDVAAAIYARHGFDPATSEERSKEVILK
jgi:ABC-type molybdate transport system substrate-binding protein